MNIDAQKQILQSRRNALIGHLLQLEDSLDEPLPTDWEDRASERQGDEVLESLGQVEQAEVRRIEAALSRMAAGSYGVCQGCGAAISEKRLAVLPDTPVCKGCAR